MPYPENAQMARSVEQIIREQGAVPATIAILSGQVRGDGSAALSSRRWLMQRRPCVQPCVGLSDAQLSELAVAGPAVKKCSRCDGQ